MKIITIQNKSQDRALSIKRRYEPDEARERILDAAEALFRRIGYSKTTVADIAGALSMSGANIYRFFPSKGAINDALCRRMLAELHLLAESVVARPGPAAQRLEELIVAVHRHNKARFTHEETVHEMVAVAMQENWEAIDEHIHFMEALFARLIQEGVEAGEFAPCDAPIIADLVGLGCCGAFHPAMIADCAGEDSEQKVRGLARLLVRGLRLADSNVVSLTDPGSSS
ncbi:transcriptional regulator, TetR family [Rhizobiales bacterium GAS191]|nr:transcriptional regulator, TetR family [Rhizobiales bacterium GAS191]SED16966.1 transcriptional regulator, TetR family [Rhizobiales bacterium GAS188]